MFKEEQLAPDDTETFVYLCSGGGLQYLAWDGEIVDPSVEWPQVRVTVGNNYLQLDQGEINDLGNIAANISGSDFGGIRNMDVPNISDVAYWFTV